MKFDEFWKELIFYAGTMTEKARESDGMCSYRTDEGRACLVGHFLTDEQVRKIDNLNASWWSLVDFKEAERAGVAKWMIDNAPVLRTIQMIHDGMIDAPRGPSFGARLVADLEIKRAECGREWVEV